MGRKCGWEGVQRGSVLALCLMFGSLKNKTVPNENIAKG